MLSNIVFIIILILLIIILGLLYFFSTDIRKNKNKINILESDLNALRERVSSLTDKIYTFENNSFTESRKKGIPGNFADILNHLGSMNNEIFENESNKEESDEEEDSEYEEDVEEDDEEEVEEDEEDDEDDEEVDEELDEEVDEADEVEEAEEPEEVEEVEEAQEVNEVEQVNDKSEEDGINKLLNELVNNENKQPIIEDIEDEPLGKPSKKELSKLDIGTIKLGSDNKTKYVIQLNKAGRKYWKKLN
jgi:hypothetical protein